MRLATYLLACLLGLAAPVLTMAVPASATAQGPPVIDDPYDGDHNGMTCCHHG